MPALIFDIETVPDYTLWSPPKVEEPPPAGPPPEVPASNPNNVLPGQLAIVQPSAVGPTPFSLDIPAAGARKPRKPRARKVAAPNADGSPAAADEPMPPLFACRPVAIAYVVLNDDMFVTNMGSVGITTHGDDERRLLREFGGFVQSMGDPRIVTFAGRTFDIPVLMLRGFRYGIAQSWYTSDHRHRYGEAHLDLFDVLTEHGALARKGYGLDAFAQVIGLPGKGEMDGTKVHGLFKAGQHAKNEGYCLADAVKTAFVFLRYQLMRGRISDLAYKQAAAYLLDTCKERRMEGVVFGCDPKRLLLEE